MFAAPDAVCRFARLDRSARADQHDDLAAGNLLAQVIEERLTSHVDLQQHYQSKRRDRTVSEKPPLTTASNDLVRDR
jgi:hypothetical protein